MKVEITRKQFEAMDGILCALWERLVNRMLEKEEWEDDLVQMECFLEAAAVELDRIGLDNLSEVC